MEFISSEYVINGIGIDLNFNKAIEYFEISSEEGNPESMFELGNIYKSNDSKKSFDNYLEASKYDHNEAQYQLGRCYEIGNPKIDIKSDIEKSIKFYDTESH